MRTQQLHRFVFGLLAVSLLMTSAGVLRAEEQNKADTARSGLEAAGRFLRQVASFRSNSHERNHTSVKAAFRDAAVAPSQSTVRVYSDGEHVALGAVISTDGYVLTKASELYGTIQCGLPGGERLEAEFVGHHRECDLALLKVPAADLQAFQLNGSEPPPVGSWLLTTDIQGGPAAIGVMSVKPRPIKSDPALLGVQLRDTDDGPQVTFVMPESAAQEAGVKVNDIVTYVDGEKMESQRELVESIRKFLPGERVRLRVKRGDTFKSLLATLGSMSSVNRRQHVQNNLGGPKLSKRNKGFPAALQHDTALHPHQCGGPLVDLDGNLVGINIAHADRVSSLALPTSAILPLLDDLKSGKLRPTPTPGEAQIALETRAEELRLVVKNWQSKLLEIEKSLGASQEAEAEALAAAERDAADAQKLLEEAREAKKKLEEAFREASEKLEDLTSELREIESKVALQSD